MSDDVANELLAEVTEAYEAHFGIPPEAVAFAPGRVNLLGEHTDYNGGFVLPISFGLLLDYTGVWTAPYMLMFGIVAVSTIWMHVAIRRMERRRHPGLEEEKYLSDVPDQPVPRPKGAEAAAPSVSRADLAQ